MSKFRKRFMFLFACEATSTTGSRSCTLRGKFSASQTRQLIFRPIVPSSTSSKVSPPPPSFILLPLLPLLRFFFSFLLFLLLRLSSNSKYSSSFRCFYPPNVFSSRLDKSVGLETPSRRSRNSRSRTFRPRGEIQSDTSSFPSLSLSLP